MSNRLATEEYEDRAFLMKGGAVFGHDFPLRGRMNDMISVRLVSAEMDTNHALDSRAPLPLTDYDYRRVSR